MDTSSEMQQARDRGETMASRACDNAHQVCADFSERAARYILSYLEKHKVASGEDITDSCKMAGIIPHDDRAFGAVYATLARRKMIRPAGFCMRRKGHGTAGGRLWSLMDKQRG